MSNENEKEEEKYFLLQLSRLKEKDDEYNRNRIISKEDNEKRLNLAIVESIIEGDKENKKQRNSIISKRSTFISTRSIKSLKVKFKDEKPGESSKKKNENKNENINNSALFEIKEEKEKEEKEEKKENDKEEPQSRPTLEKPKDVKKLRRYKTDGNLAAFGGDSKAAEEERRNRMAKKLNRARQVAKNNEKKNRYIKSADITMKANSLQKKLSDLKDYDKNE